MTYMTPGSTERRCDMKNLRALYLRVIESLYMRSIQSAAPLPGTDPDDGGHMELTVGWNSKTARNRPLFIINMKHTHGGLTSRMLMSPAQVDLFHLYLGEALADSSTKFGWVEAPDWDTRYMRVPE
jgi:hypothetical protein